MRVLVPAVLFAVASPPAFGQDIFDDGFNFGGVHLDPDVSMANCPDEWTSFAGCLVASCPNFAEVCPQMLELDSAFKPAETEGVVPSCEDLESNLISQGTAEDMTDCCIGDCGDEVEEIVNCVIMQTTGEDRYSCGGEEEDNFDLYLVDHSGLSMNLYGVSSLSLKDIRNFEMAAAQHAESVMMGLGSRRLKGSRSPTGGHPDRKLQFEFPSGLWLTGVNATVDKMQENCPNEWQGVVVCVITDCPDFAEVCPSMQQGPPEGGGPPGMGGPPPTATSRQFAPTCEEMEVDFCKKYYGGWDMGDCCMVDCAAELQSLTQCMIVETIGEDRSDCPAYECSAAAGDSGMGIRRYQTIFQVTNVMDLFLGYNETMGMVVVEYKQTVSFEMANSTSFEDIDYLFEYRYPFSKMDFQDRFVATLQEYGGGLSTIYDSGYVEIADEVPLNNTK